MAYEHLNWASKTDVGRKRKNNEDAVVGLPARGIFCVADGMGGMAAGAAASFLVVSTVTQILDCEAPPASAGDRARRVMEALSVANEKIHELAAQRGLGGAGSTVVVLAFDGRNPARAAVIHAGDSRCYRYRDGKLTQLTTDHSVAQAVGVEEKRLSAIFRGVVTRAVGTLDEVNAERTNVDVQPGDLFLICSDGLTRMINDTGVQKILEDTAGQPLQTRADALVEAANLAGGDDNTTCLLVEVGPWKPEAVLPGADSDDTVSNYPNDPASSADTVAEDEQTPRLNGAPDAPDDPDTRIRKIILAALFALITLGALLYLFL